MKKNIKILILCLPGIGDALMATPIMRALKSIFPDSQIDVLCMFEGVGYSLKNNPNINKIYKFPLYEGKYFNALTNILTLRKNKYDFSILTIPAYRKEYHIIQFMVGAKKRISHSFQTGYLRELHFLNTNLIKYYENKHNVVNNLNLLKAIDVGIDLKDFFKNKQIEYDLKIEESDDIFGKEIIFKKGWNNNFIVGIHPGSTISPSALLKRWPYYNWVKLIKNIVEKDKVKVVIFSGPDEKKIARKIFKKLNDLENIVLLEDFFLGQALGVLNNTNILVANDNGFGHLANGLKINSISLFASTDDRKYSPYNKKYAKIIRPENFSPWHRYELKRGVPKGCKGGMDLINFETVLESVKSQINHKISQSHS